MMNYLNVTTYANHINFSTDGENWPELKSIFDGIPSFRLKTEAMLAASSCGLTPQLVGRVTKPFEKVWHVYSISEEKIFENGINKIIVTVRVPELRVIDGIHRTRVITRTIKAKDE